MLYAIIKHSVDNPLDISVAHLLYSETASSISARMNSRSSTDTLLCVLILSIEMKQEWHRALSEYPAMREGKKDVTLENLFSGSFSLDWPNGVRYRLIGV
jgi:hypothetical protein